MHEHLVVVRPRAWSLAIPYRGLRNLHQLRRGQELTIIVSDLASEWLTHHCRPGSDASLARGGTAMCALLTSFSEGGIGLWL
jgi:hypothetical protein